MLIDKTQSIMEQQMTLEEYKKAVEEEEKLQYGHLGQPSILTEISDEAWREYYENGWSPAAVLTAEVMGY